MRLERQIYCDTVTSEVKRNNFKGYPPSRDSYIADIEIYIARTTIQISRINKPLTISDCIQLTNSLISGAAYSEKFVQFKRIVELILRQGS